MPCTKTGGQEAPRHQEIVTTGAGSGTTDLVQILLISHEPLVGLRTRRLLACPWQALVLMPEREQMGESLGCFGQAARRRPWQSADIALDECGIDISNGVSVPGQPPSKLITASQIVPNTVPSVPLLL